MSATVEDRVKQIVVNQLGVEESSVVGKAKFIEDLGADSLDIVELVMGFAELSERLATQNDFCNPLIS